jgi:hypothetical protein
MLLPAHSQACGALYESRELATARFDGHPPVLSDFGCRYQPSCAVLASHQPVGTLARSALSTIARSSILSTAAPTAIGGNQVSWPSHYARDTAVLVWQCGVDD